MRHGGRWPHSLAGAGKAAEEEQPLSSRLQALQRKSKGFGLHPRPAKRFPLPAPVKLQGWEAKSSRSWAGGFPHVFSHTILTLSSDTLCQIPSLFTLKSLCTWQTSFLSNFVCVHPLCLPSDHHLLWIYMHRGSICSHHHFFRLQTQHSKGLPGRVGTWITPNPTF